MHHQDFRSARTTSSTSLSRFTCCIKVIGDDGQLELPQGREIAVEGLPEDAGGSFGVVQQVALVVGPEEVDLGLAPEIPGQLSSAIKLKYNLVHRY